MSSGNSLSSGTGKRLIVLADIMVPFFLKFIVDRFVWITSEILNRFLKILPHIYLVEVIYYWFILSRSKLIFDAADDSV
jgi:hypothetical protein